MTNDEAAKTLGILRTFIAERLRLEERLETANRGTGIRTQTTAQEEALRLAIAALSAPSRDIPEGWVMVPRTIKDECGAGDPFADWVFDRSCHTDWAALIRVADEAAAAPPAPEKP